MTFPDDPNSTSGRLASATVEPVHSKFFDTNTEITHQVGLYKVELVEAHAAVQRDTGQLRHIAQVAFMQAST